MNDHPNFYAIIPANVRYDNTLCANAKLLYGEITALTSKEGFCWAGNEYFANLYNVSLRTIQRWILELKTANYIEVLFEENNKKDLDYNKYKSNFKKILFFY